MCRPTPGPPFPFPVPGPLPGPVYLIGPNVRTPRARRPMTPIATATKRFKNGQKEALSTPGSGDGNRELETHPKSCLNSPAVGVDKQRRPDGRPTRPVPHTVLVGWGEAGGFNRSSAA